GIAGWWLDGRFGTGPWLTVLGVLIGTATGFKIMWDRLNKDAKVKKSDGN
ncbi:MAG: AtpZ/AtpI family protein, partial [Syntrophomonadaceae bacterium]|nr:AtpZ/AtpI family protein [Syntrophomonadaceae bacterium]